MECLSDFLRKADYIINHFEEEEDPLSVALCEPTPIDPKGAIFVEKVSLASAPWHGDKGFFESLQMFLKDDDALAPKTQSWPPKAVEKALPRPLKRQRQSSNGSVASCDASMSDSNSFDSTTRNSHVEQWNQRYIELDEFQREFHHCLVPLHWPRNPSLAHWVKRQRHQFRIKREGKHSTVTDERQAILEGLGFVWDSHAAGWIERWNELRDFKNRHGHCNVQKKYPENPQLAVWVKCQRRQFKLQSEGRSSNMTKERIEKLRFLGFVFNPRLKKKVSYF
jgi:hypothetical protein